MGKLIDADALKDWLEIVPLTGDGGVDINELESWIAQQPTANAWIPCTERLPDKTDKYLVTVNKNGELVTTFTVWLNQENPKWASLDDVIAWQPMPEPWKGNE